LDFAPTYPPAPATTNDAQKKRVTKFLILPQLQFGGAERAGGRETGPENKKIRSVE